MSTQWKLRRLAPRALRALERHAAVEPSLAAYQQTLGPAATAYMDTYDRVRTISVTRSHELLQGKQAVATLQNKMGSRVAQLAATGAIESFDRTTHGDTPNVPDDVIADAESLVDVVTKQMELSPESISAPRHTLPPRASQSEVSRHGFWQRPSKQLASARRAVRFQRPGSDPSSAPAPG